MNLVCELCGGMIRRRRRTDYSGDPRWWNECVDPACGHAGWDMGTHKKDFGRGTRRRELTAVSGYSAPPYDPEPPCCAAVYIGRECTCQHEPDHWPTDIDWRRRVDSGSIDWAAECDAGNVDIMSMIPLGWWDGGTNG